MKTSVQLLLAVGVAVAVPSRADNVLVRPWGDNALRIQVAPSSWTLTDALPTAYLPGGAPSDGFFAFGPATHDIAGGPVVSGNIMATQGTDGLLTIKRVSDSTVLLKEEPRVFNSPASGLDSTVAFNFAASATKLYGMGQNRHANNGPGLGLNVVNESYSFQDSIAEEGGPSNSLPWVMVRSTADQRLRQNCLAPT